MNMLESSGAEQLANWKQQEYLSGDGFEPVRVLKLNIRE
jgi:hypothetical protein